MEDLLKGLAEARPSLQVFRYGSGRWGKALYRVQLSFGSYTFNVYALPSKNVPVLVGMRELKQMGIILNTGNCHALIGGHPRILSKTSKGHALLDFATDIPYTPQPSRSTMSPNKRIFLSLPNKFSWWSLIFPLMNVTHIMHQMMIKCQPMSLPFHFLRCSKSSLMIRHVLSKILWALMHLRGRF